MFKFLYNTIPKCRFILHFYCMLCGTILVISPLQVYAQEISGLEVYFQDFHKSKVTHVTASPDGNWFWSGDQSGKVLMWNASDMTVYKTVDEGGGLPVSGLRMHPNGREIIVARSWSGSTAVFEYRIPLWSIVDAEQDTLSKVTHYPVFSNDAKRITNMDADIFGSSHDDFVILTTLTNRGSYVLAVTESKGNEREIDYLAEYQVVGQASLDESRRLFALGVRNNSGIYKLEIRDMDTNELRQDWWFGEKQVIGLRFHPETGLLYSLIYDDELKQLEILVIDSETLDVSDDQSTLTDLGNASIGLLDAQISIQEQVIITVYNQVGQSKYLTFSDGKWEEKSFMNQQLGNYTNGILLPQHYRTVLFGSIFNSQVPGVYLFDHQREDFISRFTREPAGAVTGTYLPGGNWMVRSQGYQPFIKYYPKGSIMNRYSRNEFEAWINLRHQISPLSHLGYALDENSGMMAFAASRPLSLERTLFLYDLKEDELKPFESKAKVVSSAVLAYRHRSSRLLIRDQNKSDELAIITPEKAVRFEGAYGFADVSLDGGFVFAANHDQEVSVDIFDAETGRQIFELDTEHSVMNFTAGPMDESGFWLSYSKLYSGQLNERTLLFELKDDRYQIQKMEGMYLLDYAWSENLLVFLSKYGLIGFSDKRMMEVEYSAGAHSVSLSEDSSRLMVSFSDGTIRIYDTETLEEKIRMIHPGAYAQVMINDDSYYTANIDAWQWLAARSDSGSVPFEQARDFNRPDRVLESMGGADSEMLSLLERTSQLRQFRTGGTIATEIPVSQPIISKVLINGESSQSQSIEKTINVQLQIRDEHSRITGLEIQRNDVTLSHESTLLSLESGEDHHIETEITLVDGENILHFRVSNEHGGVSNSVVRSVLFESDTKPDLYLLSVGVSEYDDESFNLSFADKDAWDMAMLFGNTDQVDAEAYKSRFMGHRYFVNGPDSTRSNNEIPVYRESGFSAGEMTQIDFDGRYWIEWFRYGEQQKKRYLWDFETGERREIELLHFDNSWDIEDNERFIADPNGEFVMYIDSLNVLNRIHIESGRHNQFDLGEYQFQQLKTDQNGRLFGMLNMSSLNKLNSQNVLFSINLVNEELEIERLKIELDWNDEIVDISQDGERLLIKNMMDEIRIIYPDNPGLEQRVLGIGDSVYEQLFAFSQDGNEIVSIFESQDQENIWIWQTHSIRDTESVRSEIHIQKDRISGLNLSGGKLKWIDFRDPMVESDFRTSERLAAILSSQPVSFEQVHIKKLVNDEATLANILNELNTFFADASPNDQIVIFLAGHGLLGSDFTYYFAGSDIDFSNPEETGLSYQDIISAMDASPATRRLLLMDTCHAGEVFDMEVLAGRQPRYESELSRTIISQQQDRYVDSPADMMTLLFDQVSSEQGVNVISASGGAEVAYETTECSELENGAFTTAILNFLKEKLGYIYDPGQSNNAAEEGILLGDELLSEINTEVMRMTCNRQIPNTRERNILSRIWLW